MGGFCPGGFCPRGILSRGFCPDGFCPGGFCPRTIPLLYNGIYIVRVTVDLLQVIS